MSVIGAGRWHWSDRYWASSPSSTACSPPPTNRRKHHQLLGSVAGRARDVERPDQPPWDRAESVVVTFILLVDRRV
jgi:hypothetical protein